MVFPVMFGCVVFWVLLVSQELSVGVSLAGRLDIKRGSAFFGSGYDDDLLSSLENRVSGLGWSYIVLYELLASVANNLAR